MGHGRGGDEGGLQLWCFGTSFTYCPPSWQQEKISKSSLQQSLSSQAQVSTRPALTSPACCSCDLGALSAPHGGWRLHRVESVACRLGLFNAGYFCSLLLLDPVFVHKCHWYVFRMLLKHYKVEIVGLVELFGTLIKVNLLPCAWPENNVRISVPYKIYISFLPILKWLPTYCYVSYMQVCF